MRIYTKKEIQEVLEEVQKQGLSDAVREIQYLQKRMGNKHKIKDEDVPQGAKDILDSYLS